MIALVSALALSLSRTPPALAQGNKQPKVEHALLSAWSKTGGSKVTYEFSAGGDKTAVTLSEKLSSRDAPRQAGASPPR